jgi:hypothetical protein
VPWSAQRRRETELKGGEGQKIFNKENKERGGIALHRQGPERVPFHCLRAFDDSRANKSC